MISRQESARPLLTPGEVMQLPPHEEIVMVSGHAPVRAQKIRYFEDQNFASRALPPPALSPGQYIDCSGTAAGRLVGASVAEAAQRSSVESTLHRIRTKAAYTGIQKSVRVETKSALAVDDLLVLDESDSSRSRNSTTRLGSCDALHGLRASIPGMGSRYESLSHQRVSRARSR